MSSAAALVTGATGFLGGALADRLARDGVRVIGTGRDAARGAALEARGVRFVAHDLGDGPVPVEGDLDTVYHCAALASPWGPAAAFERSNVVATQHALATAREHGARRFVHVSTPAVQFAYRDQRGVDPDAPLPVPVNHYAGTKARAEAIVRAPEHAALRPVIVRPRAIFGPGDTVLFPRLLRAARFGLPLVRGGRALVDLAYVDNVVHGLQLAADRGRAGEIYNLSNGEAWTVRNLLDRVFSEVGRTPRYWHLPTWAGHALGRAAEGAALLTRREPRVTQYTMALLAYDMTLDLGKTRRDLGYEPEIGVAEGIRRFGQWWRTNS
jgi:nucleoside-diphosphate-sugar epimerase